MSQMRFRNFDIPHDRWTLGRRGICWRLECNDGKSTFKSTTTTISNDICACRPQFVGERRFKYSKPKVNYDTTKCRPYSAILSTLLTAAMRRNERFLPVTSKLRPSWIAERDNASLTPFI